MKKQTDDPTYAARMQAMYDRTNEKPMLRAKLGEILKGRRFKNALDVGPGPGEVTEILAEHSDQLTLVEITPSFEPILKKRFPHARLHIQSIDDFNLTCEYEAILYSQALYYQPEAEWFAVCRRLHDALRPGGILIIVMCANDSDYGKVLDFFWPKSPELRTFHYKPWAGFKAELARLGKITTHRGAFDGVFSADEADIYIGGGLLAIPDRAIIEKNHDLIWEFSEQFRQPDGCYKMKLGYEILVIEQPR